MIKFKDLNPNINVEDIVDWFRVQNYIDIRKNNSIKRITQMKVMKLLYYVQGVCLVIYNKTAFNDPILAWKYGPAVSSVHYKFRKCYELPPINNKNIQNYKKITKDTKLYQIINGVYQEYKNMSAIDLMYKTHSEHPWKSTKQGSIISLIKIKNFFARNILTL